MSKREKPAIAYLFPSGRVLVFNLFGQVIKDIGDPAIGEEWLNTNNKVSIVKPFDEWSE